MNRLEKFCAIYIKQTWWENTCSNPLKIDFEHSRLPFPLAYEYLPPFSDEILWSNANEQALGTFVFAIFDSGRYPVYSRFLPTQLKKSLFPILFEGPGAEHRLREGWEKRNVLNRQSGGWTCKKKVLLWGKEQYVDDHEWT